MRIKKRNQRGFTLVEIMIVVAIIALIAATAIPHLIRAKVNSNESTVQATLKTLSTAAEMFQQDNNLYPASVGALTTALPPYLSFTEASAEEVKEEAPTEEKTEVAEEPKTEEKTE